MDKQLSVTYTAGQSDVLAACEDSWPHPARGLLCTFSSTQHPPDWPQCQDHSNQTAVRQKPQSSTQPKKSLAALSRRWRNCTVHAASKESSTLSKTSTVLVAACLSCCHQADGIETSEQLLPHCCDRMNVFECVCGCVFY